MSVDVDIYMNNILKFFRENQKDLLNLVPKSKEEEFYNKIRETATSNHEEGKEVTLTHKQIIDICVELNKKKPIEEYLDERVFKDGPFGQICLN